MTLLKCTLTLYSHMENKNAEFLAFLIFVHALFSFPHNLKQSKSMHLLEKIPQYKDGKEIFVHSNI